MHATLSALMCSATPHANSASHRDRLPTDHGQEDGGAARAASPHVVSAEATCRSELLSIGTAAKVLHATSRLRDRAGGASNDPYADGEVPATNAHVPPP